MELVLRATAIYFFLWVVTKAMGKRELAEMSPFEMILLVTMGDLIQQGATQDDRSVTGAIITVSTITTWIMLFSYASFRVKRLRPTVEGIPTGVVHDGELVQEAIRIERVTEEEVTSEARAQGIGDLADVKLGVLEPDGNFSFVLRHEAPTRQQHHPPEREIG